MAREPNMQRAGRNSPFTRGLEFTLPTNAQQHTHYILHACPAPPTPPSLCLKMQHTHYYILTACPAPNALHPAKQIYADLQRRHNLSLPT